MRMGLRLTLPPPVQPDGSRLWEAARGVDESCRTNRRCGRCPPFGLGRDLTRLPAKTQSERHGKSSNNGSEKDQAIGPPCLLPPDRPSGQLLRRAPVAQETVLFMSGLLAAVRRDAPPPAPGCYRQTVHNSA